MPEGEQRVSASLCGGDHGDTIHGDAIKGDAIQGNADHRDTPDIRRHGFPVRLPDDIDDPRHIIDILLEERCQKMLNSVLWPVYKSVLYPLLRYGEAVKMANTISDMSGREIFDFISTRLTLNVTVEGFEHIPPSGRVIIASTHPTGIADGVAIFDALKTVRPDMMVYANRDAIRAAPALSQIIIPVEWVVEKRTRQRSRETLVETKKAFKGEQCLVLFPSGKLAYMDKNKNLIEQEWMTSVVNLARKYECDVVPVNMRARNSWLYYWFRNLGTELRDITLFNELLNKKGKPFHLTFGPAIRHQDLAGDPADVTKALQNHAIHDVVAGKAWENPYDA